MNPLDPQADYSVPKTEKQYLSFEEGETEFLPLAGAITGYEYWNEQGKPVRSSEPFEEMPDDIRIGKDGKPEKIKHFWAFPVWDCSPKATIKIKVLEITQKTIMKAILSYTRNSKWGSPVMKYSLTVNRDESGDITAYTVMANPISEISEEITRKWEEAQVNGFNINRLFDGGDPFSAAKQ